ncbi:MAG: RNA polymerase sigma factor [Sedimentisphaerales bacterium]|nr:RNA polymerase sigma factor [Sedimentisphaerales bacterium]
MEKNHDIAELVRKAQQGDKEALDCLAQLMRQELEPDVARMTLNRSLTQEIVQDTLLVMVRDIHKLRSPEHLLQWLKGIALNKFRDHLKDPRNGRFEPLPDNMASGGGDGLEKAIVNEMIVSVRQAMTALKPEQRMIINLRVYQKMSFEAIAINLGCRQFTARKKFSRAKVALEKALSRNGMSKSALIIALVVFGKFTAQSQAAAAAVTVSAEALQAGTAATITAALGTKAALTVLTAGIIVTGGAMMTAGVTGEQNQSAEIPDNQLVPVPSPITPQDDETEVVEYFYPAGFPGPVMPRVSQETKRGYSYCRFLRNDKGNFYYDRKEQIVYAVNHNYYNSDLSRMCFPQDISKDYHGIPGLLICRRDGQLQLESANTNILHQVYFQHPWSAGITIDYHRLDTMHQRAWTFFRITGHLGDKPIAGSGRITFTYAALTTHSPWLRLQVGKNEYTDAGSGRLFTGLPRPWMGLHTLDSLRHDASQKGLTFENTQMDESGKVRLTVKHNNRQLVYTINMNNDLIESIELKGDLQGHIQFDYLQEIEGKEKNFMAPQRSQYGTHQDCLELFITTD